MSRVVAAKNTRVAKAPKTAKTTKPLTSKPALIFIHGFRGNHLGLEELASKFPKKSYDVYIPDIPPAGSGTFPEYSARHYARFIANFIRKNQLKKPILIGHSMGSIVAAAVAERYPELIADKIVFLSPISKEPARFFALLTPLTAILPNKLISYITTKYMFIPKTDRELFKKVLETTYLCGGDYYSKSDVFKSARFSVSCNIADFEFSKQALFLSGEHDRLIPREKTEATAEKFHAKTAYIKNTGHLLNYEDPKATATAIKNFLRK